MQSSLVLVIPSGIAPALFSRVKGGASTEAIIPLLEHRPEQKGMPAGRNTSNSVKTTSRHQLAVATAKIAAETLH